jgi:Flp pilus assembly CpaF family ATPase
MNTFCAHTQINACVERLLPVAHLLCDPNNEISINGGRVWVDPGSGDMQDTGITIAESAIHTAIRLLVAADGGYLDPEAPFATLTLACGARFHGALRPVSSEARISIRRHPQIIRSFLDFGTQEQAELCERTILDKKNILLAGATSSGKTSCLNSLIAIVPPDERLAVVQEAPELIIRHANVIHGYASEGVDIQRHIREFLRDRPDRIIVGEVRGAEAKDAIEAAATGHGGLLCTIHANSAREALTRLARLANYPTAGAVIAETIHLVLFLQRLRDGRRRITEVFAPSN